MNAIKIIFYLMIFGILIAGLRYAIDVVRSSRNGLNVNPSNPPAVALPVGGGGSQTGGFLGTTSSTSGQPRVVVVSKKTIRRNCRDYCKRQLGLKGKAKRQCKRTCKAEGGL
jgi:hypothetical protein